jgi:uncharacterized iron-regulated protein
VQARILKLEGHDEQKEIEFELDFLLSLTIEQRVQLVLERSRLLLEMLARDGHPIVPGVSKRG